MTVDLPVYDHRRGSGPTLVLLHYWGGSSRTWQPVVDQLQDRDVLRIDFRGWARSRGLPGPFSLQQLAADVVHVVDDAGVDEFLLVGHSMGGKVAQLVAATCPGGLRGVVLVASGPAVPAAEITASYQQRLSHAYDTAEAVAYARDSVLTASPLTDPLKAQVLDDSRAAGVESTAQWPLHGITEDISDQTRRIEAPTLVVAGEHDVVEPAAVLRENLLPYLGDARFVVLPGTGHLVPLETPAALAAAVVEFADHLHGASARRGC